MTAKDPAYKYDWRPEQWDEWGLHLPQWSHVKTGPQSGIGRRVIVDIEADGLLQQQGSKKEATQFWCIACVDVDTGEEFYWGWEQFAERDVAAPAYAGPADTWLMYALTFLSQCSLLLGHNAIGFDYPVTEKLYGWTRPEKCWDTMVIAKAVWPVDALKEPDFKLYHRGQMPAQMIGRHSLKAWGLRTGTHKGDYQGGFEEWCPAMAVYLMGDIRGTLALWKLIINRIGWAPDSKASIKWPERSLEVENFVADMVFKQELYGVNFDKGRAIRLAAELANQLARIDAKLVETFGTWWQPLDDPEVGTTPAIARQVKMVGYPDVTLRRVSEKTGKELAPYVGPPLEHYSPDAPFVRIERTTFNPQSRQHLGMRLQAVFGWKPKEFGGKNKDEPKVDETTLEAIPDAVMPAETRQLILDYFVVSKTLGMLSKGQKAWLRLVGEDGRVHGQMDTIGAVTRRGTHKNPNLSQCPSVRKEKLEDGSEVVLKGLAGRYGWECRELFVADEGWELTGTDASSLELIDLGHYLARYDDGAFSARVCDPTRDAHKEHSVICGTTRADAKTTIYLFVYGGSAYKLSLDPGIKVTPDMVPGLLGYRGLPMMLKSLAKRFDDDFVRKLDDMQKARIARCRIIILALESGITGLKDLKKSVEEAAGRGYLKAMDGSRIVVRKDYAALNSLLQSAGALSCKLWIMLFHKEMWARGYRLYEDYMQVLWVHDEMQITHRPGLHAVVKEVAELAMVRAGEELGLKGRYRTDAKLGRNWAECH